MTERKTSQLRDGSRGRLSSHDGGIPVNSRAVRKPDFLRGGGGNSLILPLHARYTRPEHGTSIHSQRTFSITTQLQFSIRRGSACSGAYTSSQSKNWGVKYEGISVAPARTILSVLSKCHHAQVIYTSAGTCNDHCVLSADLLSREWVVRNELRSVRENLEVRQGGLHHDYVCALRDIALLSNHHRRF